MSTATLASQPTKSRTRTPVAPKIATLAANPDGTLTARSSDGVTTYHVSLLPLACDCRGFTHYGHCYHVATVARGQAGAFFVPVPPALRPLWQANARKPRRFTCRCTCTPVPMEPGEQCAACGRYWPAAGGR